MLALAFVVVLAVGLVTLGVFGVIALFRSDVGNLPALLKKMAEIVEGRGPRCRRGWWRRCLPPPRRPGPP